MSFQRHGDGHTAIRPLRKPPVLFTVLSAGLCTVLALSGCGSGQTADQGSDGEQTETASTDAGAEEDSADDSTSTTRPADEEASGTSEDDSDAAADDGGEESAGGEEPADNEDTGEDDTSAGGEEEDEDVGEIDPDEIELNPDVVNPPDKNTPAPTTPADSGYDGALEPLVQQAKNNLGSRLGIEASAISVRSAKAMTWPDAAAGCPRPGMAYAQVITDGTEIVLSAQGGSYRYTTGGSQTAPTLCES